MNALKVYLMLELTKRMLMGSEQWHIECVKSLDAGAIKDAVTGV